METHLPALCIRHQRERVKLRGTCPRREMVQGQRSTCQVARSQGQACVDYVAGASNCVSAEINSRGAIGLARSSTLVLNVLPNDK